MKRMMRAEMAGKVVDGGIRAISAAIFSAAALYGGYAPFTVGMVAAAGDGWRGLSALCGAIGGALLFLDFSHALRTIATCVLLFTANNAFYDLKTYQKPWFRAAMAMGLMVSVEFVYVLRAGVEEIAGCLICLLIAAAAAYSCEQVLNLETREKHSEAVLFVLLGFLMAVSSLETESGFAPGRIIAMLSVMLIAFEHNRSQAISAALCIGLAADLVSSEGTFLHAAAYTLSALVMSFSRRGDRVCGALWYVGGIIIFSLPLYAGCGVLLVYEGLAATLCFLLIPTRFLRGKRESGNRSREEKPWNEQLKNSAAALRGIYESAIHAKRNDTENPAVIYDRAAEKVCRDCSLCNTCWEKEYSKNHTALNDAMGTLLKNGTAEGADFPSFFVDRCIRFPKFLGEINTELTAYLLRRSYRQKISDAQQQALGQYAEISEMLDSAANQARAVSAVSTATVPYQIGIALRPKQGEKNSGDYSATFETEDKLCIVLSDGMGSGEEARKESSMAVRLLEKFLRAGIDAAPALKTLNSALMLRAEMTDRFTTIDLLTLSLRTGDAEIYKYGAAPSYIKRGGTVKRINCSSLPAGLQGNAPEATHLSLEGGMFLVMMTDGVVDVQEDAWLQNLLAGWEGENPQLLVSAILADSIDHKGKADDAGVVVLYLPCKEIQETKEI